MAEKITVFDLEDGKVDIDTLEDIVNLQEPTTETRLSGPVKTWYGVKADLEAEANDQINNVTQNANIVIAQTSATADAVLKGLGYLPPVPYASGLSMTEPNQTVSYDGNSYAPIDDQLPFTTSGTFESDKFRLVAGIVGSDLSDPSGAGLVGLSQDVTYPAGTVGKKARSSIDGDKTRGVGGFAVAAVIRRSTVEGPTWQTIDNSTHKAINWLGTGAEGSNLTVNFAPGPVGAFIAAPDNEFALAGCTTGISGGGGSAVISMGAPCSFKVNLSTLECSGYNETLFGSNRFNAVRNVAGQQITLSHPSLFAQCSPVVQYVAQNVNGSVYDVHYLLSDGIGDGSTTLQLVGDAEGLIRYDTPSSSWVGEASVWDAADFNITWNAAEGEITVTHPLCLGSPSIFVSAAAFGTGNYWYGVVSRTANSFVVRVRDFTGAIPALTSSVRFFFDRGRTAPVKNATGTLLVHLGHVQVAMSQVDTAGGNIWCIAINNES